MGIKRYVHAIDLQNVEPLQSEKYVIPEGGLLSTADSYSLPIDNQSADYDISSAVKDIVSRRYFSGGLIGKTLSTHISNTIGLYVLDSLWGQPGVEVISSGNDWCFLTFRLSGNSIDSIGGKDYSMGPYNCFMVHLTEGLDYLFRLIGKKPLTEVYIIFRSSLLANKLSSDVAGCEGLSSFSCCQMTPEIEQVLQSVISYSPYTPAYRLYAEAKAMELIALYLAELDRQNQTVSLATASSKYQRQYYAAKNYLDRHFCTPPTIEELSHIVGLNRRQLSEGFKLSFGKTIYQYSQSLRMEKAKFLLRDPQENISSVAEQLGYHYQSNFTKAFLRYVGVRPKEFFNIQKANHLKE